MEHNHHLSGQSFSNGHVIVQTSQPRIVAASSSNYTRVREPYELKCYTERPLCLNAWTQTSGDDFCYLQEANMQPAQPTQKELELMEKVRILEENLRAHSELLSQIHATSAQINALQLQIQPPHNTSTPQSINVQQLEQQGQQQQQEIQQQHHQLAAAVQTLDEPHMKPQNVSTVIQPLQHVSSPHDSVKYTIIAEANGAANGEPIEIQLAEDEDSAINLNNSADEGRLEICLAEDQKADNKAGLVKMEKFQQPSPTSTSAFDDASGTACFKRRKVSSIESSPAPQTTTSSNYYFDERGVLTPISTILNTPDQNTPSTSQGKRPYVRRKNENKLSPVLPHHNRNKIMVSIGPNNTRIPAHIYQNMSWTSASIATRKLLMTIFDRETLATHSMTGKPSPAFKESGKPPKEMLNPYIIQDIIFAVSRKCNVSEKEVRNAITTKCADENKMLKLQQSKEAEMNKENQANQAPKPEEAGD